MTETTSPQPRSRVRRVLAVVAGVAAVPALYAVADAAIDTSPSGSQTAATVTTGAGTETELEHGTTTTGDDRDVDATPLGVEPGEHPVPEPEPAEGNETEIEHGVVTTQPHGGEGHDGAPSSTLPAAPVTQTFTSAGGSITVTLANGALSLDATSAAPGFSVEVHDARGDRVEVRFVGAGIEWRIRVEPAAASMSVEINQHD